MTAPLDVFISYSRPDRERARTLATLLEANGYSVWWDWNLIGGQDYREEIQKALTAARKVIVLWSEHSISSPFVLDEAGHAREHAKLVPVVIDGSSPPFGFGNLHTLTSHDFAADSAAILATLEHRARPTAQTAPVARRPGPSRRVLLGGGAAAAALVTAAGGAWWATSQQAPAPVPTGAQVNRIALVIGVNDYLNVPDLNNARNDAQAVSAALQARGFKVMEVLDPGTDAAGIRAAIDRFKTLLALGGVGLFYYAGQAAHIRGHDYLVPRDAPMIDGEEALIAASIEIGDVTGPIENFLAGTPGDARTAGVCIGSAEDCADGTGLSTASQAVQSDAAPQSSPLPPRVRDNGLFMVYSANEGELAMDGVTHEDRNSPFAQALLAEIGAGDGELSGLARRVRARVKDVTEGDQNPVMEDHADAPFFFNRPESDPAEGVLRIVMLDSCRDNPFALARR